MCVFTIVSMCVCLCVLSIHNLIDVNIIIIAITSLKRTCKKNNWETGALQEKSDGTRRYLKGKDKSYHFLIPCSPFSCEREQEDESYQPTADTQHDHL